MLSPWVFERFYEITVVIIKYSLFVNLTDEVQPHWLKKVTIGGVSDPQVTSYF